MGKWGHYRILSIFSVDAKPSIMSNFSHLLADYIHQQLGKFPIEDVFKYAFVLVYMFLYFQGDNVNLSLQKLDEKGN